MVVCHSESPIVYNYESLLECTLIVIKYLIKNGDCAIHNPLFVS